jgi:hypothetical protein
LEIAQLLHEECIASIWLEPLECSNPALLGVAVRGPNNDYTFEPAFMDQKMKTAVEQIGHPVVFSMSSEFTSSLFRFSQKMSPYQTELIIQPRGTKIPVIDSLDNITSRIKEIKESFACLVKDESIALIWANNAENAKARGSDFEQMMMETVSCC